MRCQLSGRRGWCLKTMHSVWLPDVHADDVGCGDAAFEREIPLRRLVKETLRMRPSRLMG